MENWATSFSPGDLLGLDVLRTQYITSKRGWGEKKVLFCLFVQSAERISCLWEKDGKIVSFSSREDDETKYPGQSAVLVHQGSDWLLLFKDVSLCVIDLPNSRRRRGPFGWSLTPPASSHTHPDYTSLISHYVLFRLERSLDLKQWMKAGTTDRHLSPWLWRVGSWLGGGGGAASGAAGSWVLISFSDLVFGLRVAKLMCENILIFVSLLHAALQLRVHSLWAAPTWMLFNWQKHV